MAEGHKTAISISSDQRDKHLQESAITHPKSTNISGWFHWHEPGTSKEEKRLIFKLDWFLLSYSCLMFFVKQLDGNNVTNAYASGMSEELGFGPGNELSWMNTYCRWFLMTESAGDVANPFQSTSASFLEAVLLIWP